MLSIAKFVQIKLGHFCQLNQPLAASFPASSFNPAVSFPRFLGKTSTSDKKKRLTQNIHDRRRLSTSGSQLSLRLDYAPILVEAIVRPLREQGTNGIKDTIKVMKEYQLTREDIDSLIELSVWPKMKNPWESIDGKVKAALTRVYKKEIPLRKSVKNEAVKFDYEDATDSDESYNEENCSIKKSTQSQQEQMIVNTPTPSTSKLSKSKK